MFTTLSGSLPFLEAELDYRRERLIDEARSRRDSRAVRLRPGRPLRLRGPRRRSHGVAAAQ
jgi:hypothetical protein